jgi:hypothetical protein
MKKSYQSPTLHIVRLQHQTQLLQGTTTTQGKFINDEPPGGWDEGGANSRRGGWDDEE